MNKKRLDQLLVDRGLAQSRHKAQALIMSGSVLVKDTPITKAGYSVPIDAELRLRGEIGKYVGRGGEKIEAAFDYFQVPLSGIIALDVGASTGGFTDCMLQRGVQLVYATDVGTNQLDYKLRQDPRVVVREKTHALQLKAEDFSPRPNLATIDLSFIGLRKVLPAVVSVLVSPFGIVALVKPQFELGPEFVSKGGVVKQEEAQKLAVTLVEETAADLGLERHGYIPSPLKGEKKGNQEYFVYFTKT